ncbi:MAG: hypothetical protein ACE5FD_19935 [Anaerolineae bacterium]
MFGKKRPKECPHCGSKAIVFAKGPLVYGGSGYCCLDCGNQVDEKGTAVSDYRLVKR